MLVGSPDGTARTRSTFGLIAKGSAVTVLAAAQRPRSVTEIAKATGRTRQGTARVVADLVRAGLLRLSEDGPPARYQAQHAIVLESLAASKGVRATLSLTFAPMEGRT